ncbi:MAG: hypothetical protein Kow0097_13380 [Candidatus Bipolaricaulota bacterium]|nr:protease inhibitor I42 family protein [Candidatus Bipolaricaulota bacterium]
MNRIGLVVALVVGMAVGASPQASSAIAISKDEQVKVTIGTFFFVQGQVVALEIARADPCPCLCDELLVTGFQVLDAAGTVVYVDETVLYPAPVEGWIGRWDLVSGDGEEVPAGKYTALVGTSIGEFRAELEVAAAGASGGLHSSAQATVCGIGLGVYRLVEEGDAAGVVSLRVGERMLVALPGNPTTGYAWEVEGEPAFLTRLEGVAYRSESELIGAGGTFYFRYEATATGEGELSFAYRRPWEAVPPAQTVSLTVIVR